MFQVYLTSSAMSTVDILEQIKHATNKIQETDDAIKQNNNDIEVQEAKNVKDDPVLSKLKKREETLSKDLDYWRQKELLLLKQNTG